MLARRRPPIDIILPTRSVSMVLETNFFVVSLVTNLNNKRSVCDSQWCLQLSLKRTPLYIKLSWEVGIAVKQNKITQDKILLTWHVTLFNMERPGVVNGIVKLPLMAYDLVYIKLSCSRESKAQVRRESERPESLPTPVYPFTPYNLAKTMPVWGSCK